MFVLTGASGSGKTTIAERLAGTIEDPIIFDADTLWAPEMNTPDDGYARFRSTWMRLAANVAQSGHSVLLVGAGMPEQYDARPERRYLGAIHWLALVASERVLESRLRGRPAWRGVNDASVETMLAYNHRLTEQTNIPRIDTSRLSIEDTTRAVLAWIDTNRTPSRPTD